MKEEIKKEWCENWIKARFTKHHGRPGPNAGIEVNLFWSMAEASGLWTRGTYNTPMTHALEKLCTVETILNDKREYCYTVFKLKPATA